MFHDNKQFGESCFRNIAFSDKVWRCLDRARPSPFTFIPTDTFSIQTAISVARKDVKIASDEAILDMLVHNPNVIFVTNAVESVSVPQGILALLPLNADGLEAICTGKFEGREPDKRHICRDGERAKALYIWLAHMPCTFSRLLAASADAIDTLSKSPVPIFSVATNEHAQRLHIGAGFKEAANVRIARTIDDILRVFSIRSATYLAEQFCSYDEEFDGNDFCATHFLGLIDEDPAACIRVRFFNGFAKIERLAVRSEYRKSRLAFQLPRVAIEHCRKKGYTRIMGHSRIDLLPFWKTFGFHPKPTDRIFSFANVKYREMDIEIEPDENAIMIDTDPMVIIRPEGSWATPGPFDRATKDEDRIRKQLLSEASRTVRNQSISA
jgi:predicted GNAT family N-acyltransferase